MRKPPDIRDHPKFRRASPFDDSSQEHRDYMEFLDGEGWPPAGETGLDAPHEQVGEVATEPRRSQQGLSNCRDCVWQKDRRPWYRRWSTEPKSTDLVHLVCQAYPKEGIRHPITGSPAYILPGEFILSSGDDEPFHRCHFINSCGTCPLFSSKPPAKVPA